jgi:hypothetical protein
MFDFLKRLILFAIGLYLIIFFAKIIFNEFSLTGIATDITGSLNEFQKIGGQNSSTGGYTYGGSGSANLVTSKGAERAVTLSNLSRGNMIKNGDVIDGSAPGTWFFQGVSTARFYDESGTEIGVSQMLARGDTKTAAQVPFIATVQFRQGYNSQTGYVSFENANTSGDPKKLLRFVLPITYPVENQNQNTGGYIYNATTSGQTTYTSVQSTTTFSGNALPAPR